MNTFIILTTLLVGWKFLSPANQKAVYIFAFPVLVFNYIGEGIPDDLLFYYYFLAAVTDLFIIMALSKLTYKTKFASKLQKICIAFMLANFFGWIIYKAELPPDVYEMICTVLYLWVLFSTIGGIKDVLGDSAMDSRNHNIFSNHPARDYVLSPEKKAARD